MATKSQKKAKPTAEKDLTGNSNAVKVYNTVKQHAEKHPAFTELSLRNLIFYGKTNGLESALVRIGRKVLIDEGAFFSWIESQKEKAA